MTEAIIILVAVYAVCCLLAWRICRVTSIAEQTWQEIEPVSWRQWSGIDEEYVMSDEELAEFAAQVQRNVARNALIRSLDTLAEEIEVEPDTDGYGRALDKRRDRL
jgi:hypothetical protein